MKDVIFSDCTMLIVARDSENIRFYYNTCGDQTIRLLDLSRLDLNARSIKKISTKSKQPIVDMTDSVK